MQAQYSEFTGFDLAKWSPDSGKFRVHKYQHRIHYVPYGVLFIFGKIALMDPISSCKLHCGTLDGKALWNSYRNKRSFALIQTWSNSWELQQGDQCFWQEYNTTCIQNEISWRQTCYSHLVHKHTAIQFSSHLMSNIVHPSNVSHSELVKMWRIPDPSFASVCWWEKQTPSSVSVPSKTMHFPKLWD